MARVKREERPAIIAAVIEGLKSGTTVRETCRKLEVDRATVWGWIMEEEETEKRYRGALRAFAANCGEEALTVARGSVNQTAAADRLLVEQLRWLAGKADPARWGDRQVVEHQGGQEMRVKVIEDEAPVRTIAATAGAALPRAVAVVSEE